MRVLAQDARRPCHTRFVILALGVLLVSGVLSATASRTAEAAPPALTVTPHVTGLSSPWDIGFTPDGTLLWTVKAGGFGVRLPNGTVRSLSTGNGLAQLLNAGETGLMGLAVDPSFSGTRRIYACQGYQSGGVTDIRVYRWTINADFTGISREANPILSNFPVSTGRHGGCRLRFDVDAQLYVSVGDAAIGANPQSPNSLGGKILRVDRSGQPAAGNPYLGRPYPQPFIYTFGHRNPQGLAAQPGTRTQMFSAEHGTGRDDEINRLGPGANYGWDPVPGYDESRPMTDFGKFPGATGAVYSTGSPTLAISGIAFFDGAQWGDYNGLIAAATLKNQQLLAVNPFNGAAVAVPELNGFGRLRTPLQGPDGSLYVSTSNGSNDRILRITPAPLEDLLHLRNAANAGSPDAGVFAFGSAANDTLACDVNGDGRDDIASYQGGTWSIRTQLSAGSPTLSFSYGGAGWTPVCGDWDGDGTDGIGVYVNGNWYLRHSASPGQPDYSFGYGGAGHLPVVGDWNGDGVDSVGAVNTANYVWLVRNTNSSGTANAAWQYGFAGALPVPGNFAGFSTTELGLYINGTWYLRDAIGPGAAREFSYGGTQFVPVVGDWNSDRLDGIGVVRST